MKKRIAMALSMLMVMLMLGACGTDSATVDYNGYSYSDLETDMYTYVSYAQQLAYFYEQNDLTEDTITADITEALISNYGFTQEQLDAGFRWMEIEDELGEVVEADEDSFEVTKSGNTLTTDLTITFTERDVDFQVVYTYYSMEVSGVTIEPIYSMGEKLAKAGMNTVISLLIVFAMLILISLIISCFRIFPYIEKKRAQKAAAQSNQDMPVQPPVQQPAPKQEQPYTDDTELVAVIAAAIAADTGTSTSDFVVRSINRRA